MSRTVEGRRVDSVEEIERPGDYAVKYAEDGGISSVWFSMPGFPHPLWNRINGPAWMPGETATRWDVTEDSDGKVTVSPSILSEWTWGPEKARRRFHGYLKGGVWELLDDCVGAEL